MFFIFISTVISWCSDIYSNQQYDRDGQLIATEPCLTPPFAEPTNICRDYGLQDHCLPCIGQHPFSISKHWFPAMFLAVCLEVCLQKLVQQCTAWDPETCSVATSIRRQLLGSSNWRPYMVWSWSTSWLPRWLLLCGVGVSDKGCTIFQGPSFWQSLQRFAKYRSKKDVLFPRWGRAESEDVIREIHMEIQVCPTRGPGPKPVVIESPVTWVGPWLHTVGRVWGACRGVPSSGPKFTISLAIMLEECEPRTLGGSFHPWGQRIPIPILGCMGCMTVRRCAKVLAGGVRRFLAGMLWGEAKHIVKSSHQVTMLIAFTLRGWLCCCAAVRMNYRPVRGRCSFALFLRFCPMGFRT